MGKRNVWDRGRWAGVKSAEFDFMTKYIFEKISLTTQISGKRILELGCGTGRLSYLALKAGAKSVTLVDSSESAIRIASKLFFGEPEGSYEIIRREIFDFFANVPFDVVLSSGLIEHFRGRERAEIIRKHISLCSEKCVIIHPSETIYASLFNRIPPVVRLYGFQKSYSNKEMQNILGKSEGVKWSESFRFHPFYTVPLLHNCGFVNRFLDDISVGAVAGGLTLTRIDV